MGFLSHGEMLFVLCKNNSTLVSQRTIQIYLMHALAPSTFLRRLSQGSAKVWEVVWLGSGQTEGSRAAAGATVGVGAGLSSERKSLSLWGRLLEPGKEVVCWGMDFGTKSEAGLK